MRRFGAARIHMHRLALARSSRTAPGAALALGALLCALARPAFAHHAMDGRLPTTAWEGLLSGLAHPVIGLDHLAFVIGVGIWSVVVGLRWTAPVVFVLGTLIGCGLHLESVNLPFSEGWVALSLVAAGLGFRWAPQPRTPILGSLLAVAGVVHGYAYGESIVGAPGGALGAYLCGFALVQIAIAVAAAELYRRVRSGVPARAARLGQAWAMGAYALGTLFLALQIVG
jgi:urease accessory protein